MREPSASAATFGEMGGPAPCPPNKRFDAIDALRGLAVLGIFVINICGFSMPHIGFSHPLVVGGDGAINHGLWTATSVLVEGSMRGLFSLMFGAGVILFTERAHYPDGEIRIADLYYRRTIWLVIFGLVHSFLLLMPGDILLIYGLAGLFLFPFRILPPHRLLCASAAMLAILVGWALVEELPQSERGGKAAIIASLVEEGAPITPAQSAALEAWREEIALPTEEELKEEIAARTGSPATVFLSNAKQAADNSSIGGLMWWVSDGLMMMLLGMAFYKWRIITAERSHRFYLCLAGGAYAIGLSIRIWAIWTRWDTDFSPMTWAPWIIEQPGRVAMTVGHIGAFFSLWKFFASSLPMRALAAAGRMALSNYITQTVIANLIFSGIGLGLFGSLDRVGVYLIMAAIWIAQLTFSMWWLARFRFGPLEWGWRSLTYWRRQPIRKIGGDADMTATVS